MPCPGDRRGSQANATRFLGLDGGRTEHNMASVMAGAGGDPYSYVYSTRIPASTWCLRTSRLSRRTSRPSAAAAGPGCSNSCSTPSRPMTREITGIASSTARVVYSRQRGRHRAADDVIVPVKIDAFALSGMRELMGSDRRSAKNPPSHPRRGRADYHVARSRPWCRARNCCVHPAYRYLRRTSAAATRVDESTFAGEALGSYSRYSSAARDYSAFVAEYLEGCENG